MPIAYLFRKPRFPVIVIAGDRAFSALSSAAVERLMRRELKAGVEFRLLDSQWAWFSVVAGEVCAIAPSVTDFRPPTKQAVISLANGRSV
jgi:hypothetical protein